MSQRTPAQINASRENGALSKGPITGEGKMKVANNAIKHGLTSRTLVLATESKEAFELLRQSFDEIYNPANDAEWLMVEEMVACTWRLRRSWGIQTAQFDLQMLRDDKFIQENFKTCEAPFRAAIAEENLTEKNAHLNLRRHEERLCRQFQRAYKLLMDMQDRRKAEMQNKPKQPQATQAFPPVQTVQTPNKETITCSGPSQTPSKEPPLAA